MSGATLRDQLAQIVVDTLRCAPVGITDAADMAALGADSLDLVEIVMRVEEECAVTITDEEIEGLSTFGDLVALVERKRVPA